MQIDDVGRTGHEHDGRLALLPLAVVRRELITPEPGTEMEIGDDGIGVPVQLLRDQGRVVGAPRDPDGELRTQRERQNPKCRLVVVDEEDPRPPPLHDRLTGRRLSALGRPPNGCFACERGSPTGGPEPARIFAARRQSGVSPSFA